MTQHPVTLKKIVEGTDTHAGRIFDWTVQSLIVISMISFSLETLPDLADWQRSVLHWMEVVTVVVFTCEYLLRIYVATHPWKFVSSFFGLIDLAAILPFYLATGLDLRTVRAFRLLRVVRILKLVRYSQALRRFHRAFLLAKEELYLFLFLAGIVLYLAAVGIYYFENQAQPEQFSSVFQSLWWAMVTLTTVGYGDVYPITVGGKCFTFLVLIVGLGVVSVPAGLIAAALSKARESEERPSGADKR
jgi:voltage-gated potassium channel